MGHSWALCELTHMIPGMFERTAAEFERGRGQGLHTGAQLYISQAGAPVANLAFGESRPGVPMTPDHIILWFSAAKPFTAVAIGQLWESGRLDLDDPVARFIPEFAARGKEFITIRHLLTHTAGFRWVEWSTNWDEMIAKIAAAPLEPRWIAGTSAGYHPTTSWFILGEIIRRLDSRHRPFEQYMADEILRPAGMSDVFFAMTPQEFSDDEPRIAPMSVTNHQKLNTPAFDTAAGAAVCSPGGSARGPARQLGRFYEILLNHGAPLISPQTTEALVSRHRTGLHDLTFKHVIDWGLGFILNSAQYGEAVPYGFGPAASSRAFGHGGNQSSIAYADPESKIVVVLIFNGMPGEPAHQDRMRRMLTAVEEDLGRKSETRNQNGESTPNDQSPK